jgi:DNA-binding protein H-NS
MPRGRFRLSAMSTDELLTLRDNVSRAVSEKISELRTQLQRLAFEARSSSGAKAQRGRRGGKVPPKYRDPENPSNVWAGRGAEPRWLREKIRAGAKREEFLIGTSETSPRKKRSKKSARRATKTTVRARAKTKVKSKRSKQTRAKPKLRRATGRKRESAAKLPQSAPTSAAATESGA